MVKKRGQVSIEYLIVVGMVVFFITGTLGIAFYYSNNIKDQVKITQVQNFVNKVITSSETVYYSGSPSRVTISGYLPPGVNNITGLPFTKGIYLELNTSSGTNKMFFESNVDIEIDINLNEGLKKLKIEAENDRSTVSSS